MHVVLHKAFDLAISDGPIPRNAAKGVKVPQTKKKEFRPLAPEQVKVLEAAAATGSKLSTSWPQYRSPPG